MKLILCAIVVIAAVRGCDRPAVYQENRDLNIEEVSN